MFVPKKRFQELSDKVNELSELVKGEEYKRLKADSEELKKMRELVSHVRFRVKDVRAFEDGKVRVIYELPTVVIGLDQNGDFTKDDFFYATNYLDMISYDDMREIQKKLNEIKKSS